MADLSLRQPVICCRALVLRLSASLTVQTCPVPLRRHHDGLIGPLPVAPLWSRMSSSLAMEGKAQAAAPLPLLGALGAPAVRVGLPSAADSVIRPAGFLGRLMTPRSGPTTRVHGTFVGIGGNELACIGTDVQQSSKRTSTDT